MKKITLTLLSVISFLTFSNACGQNIEQKLQAVSNEINKSLPKMMDRSTRMDSTYVVGNSLNYNYTIVTHSAKEIDVAKVKPALYERTKNGVCSSSDAKVLIDNNVDLFYTYFDKTGIQVMQIKVSKKDCIK